MSNLLAGMVKIRHRSKTNRCGEWINKPCVALTHTGFVLNEEAIKHAGIRGKVRVYVSTDKQRIVFEGVDGIDVKDSYCLSPNEDHSENLSLRKIMHNFPATAGKVYRAEVQGKFIAVNLNNLV